jgi:hypothetical protein
MYNLSWPRSSPCHWQTIVWTKAAVFFTQQLFALLDLPQDYMLMSLAINLLSQGQSPSFHSMALAPLDLSHNHMLMPPAVVNLRVSRPQSSLNSTCSFGSTTRLHANVTCFAQLPNHQVFTQPSKITYEIIANNPNYFGLGLGVA